MWGRGGGSRLGWRKAVEFGRRGLTCLPRRRVAAPVVLSGGREAVSVEFEEVVGGGDQSPLGADGGSAASVKSAHAAVELRLAEDGLDHRLALSGGAGVLPAGRSARADRPRDGATPPPRAAPDAASARSQLRTGAGGAVKSTLDNNGYGDHQGHQRRRRARKTSSLTGVPSALGRPRPRPALKCSIEASFARRSSRFSPRRRLSSSPSNVVSCAVRSPASACALRTQPRNDSEPTFMSFATCALGRPDSSTVLTARSRNSYG